MLYERDMLSVQERINHADLASACFLRSELYQNTDTILLYAAIRSELDPQRIFLQALEDGKKVYFPATEKMTDTVNKIDQNSQEPEMHFFRVHDLSELKEGNFRVPEPTDRTEEFTDLNSDAVILVPGVCFDEHGNRCGYGKGYYDCYLKDHPKLFRIGFCHEIQVLREIPHENTDVCMHLIITENGRKDIK